MVERDRLDHEVRLGEHYAWRVIRRRQLAAGKRLAGTELGGMVQPIAVELRQEQPEVD